MTYDPAATLTYLETLLTNTGVFVGGVQLGEPFSPPVALTAAIFFRDLDPLVTLGTTIDVWMLQVRVYAKAGMTPTDAATTETSVAQGAAAVETALAGHFTLGGTVRAIDWAGEEAGQRLHAQWGHLVISGTIFCVVDFMVPLIVDDAATFAP